MTSPTLIKKIYGQRPAWSKKGDFGKLLVVGGSALYSGSPIFNALAAYRSGCDLVKIVAPEKTAYSIRSYAPDLIAYPVDTDVFGTKHSKTVLDMQKESDAMVIGGGLGRSKETIKFVRAVLKKTKIPAIADADALHALQLDAPGARRSALKLNKNFIVTPHAREFFVLSGKKVNESVSERSLLAKNLAKEISCTVLLKGHIDVITDGKRTSTNQTGSPFMTKGGFGDTLAGICGSLLARGVSSYEAACAAAYINGLAGQKAAKKFGEGVLASDLIGEISNVIR